MVPRHTNNRTIWILLIVIAAGGVLIGALLLRFHGVRGTAPAAGPALSFEGGPTVQVLVADTDQTREQGLSGHAPLTDQEGMLFFFDTSGRPAFWMKDMLFSLDIIWISSDWQVADITPNLSPNTYPESFAPDADIQYVLEVPAGFAQRHGVHIGQQINRSGNFQK